MTRRLSRNGIRQALRLARAARASIAAKKKAYAGKIEEVEQYLGLMQSRHLVLEQREADAYERIGDVRYVMSQNGIPEVSYSDSEGDDDGDDEAIALTHPPSVDVAFSDQHRIEAMGGSDSSDASGEGTDGGSEANQEAAPAKERPTIPTHAPHAVTMVAEPLEGPSRRGST
ncbi:hypothetical protein FIBSPDRAFT_926197 [Athelia psychrophila]|uniref:Uncharacterized protein n=1 Tax=Athelia psychrophila TaxID=1759441 RepID=A0A166TKR7_9AGAM|nr:hypothetical protein FIBSPDRAFT_926197 [Fibularhizoctonia sp. CBS 109695]